MDNMKTWAEEQLSAIERKLSSVLERNRGVIPYTSENGRYVDMSSPEKIGAWTNGFFSGLLWLLYSYSGKDSYKEAAIEREEKLDVLFSRFSDMDHDAGFRWILSSVDHYRNDGNEDAKERALAAAQSLAGRFSLRGHYIRAWNNWVKRGIDNRGKVIIDTMMNLPLLWWASSVTKDPSFADIAISHAVAASSALIRPDGSVSHIALFDSETGALKGTEAGQGYAVGSMWTRGQAWGIYGFALASYYTGSDAFRSISERVADNFILHIPEDGIIPVDFLQPDDCTFRDDSAAAAASSALLFLSSITPDEERRKLYEEKADFLLHRLMKGADLSENTDPILLHASAKFNEEKHGYPIIYADYFLVEALMRASGRIVMMW